MLKIVWNNYIVIWKVIRLILLMEISMKLDWSLLTYRFISDFISLTKRQHRFTKCLVVIWVRKNTNILNIEMGTSIKQSFFSVRAWNLRTRIYILYVSSQLPSSAFRTLGNSKATKILVSQTATAERHIYYINR